MAYWIVYQGTSWRRARAGGYLWAPKRGKKNQSQVYWSNMERVKPGDLIFAGADNAIRALAEVASPAYAAERPDPRDDQFWYGEGWRLNVVYTDLPSPFRYADWVPEIVQELPVKHSPFREDGSPNQGYLYELPVSVGEYVVERLARLGADVVASAHAIAPAGSGGETERQILSSARIGQGKFREDLIKRWDGKCAVSGLSRRELLRASHIKPWSASNNVERLDPNNGLLLSAAYDAAFDAYLISFADNGSLVLADDFTVDEAKAAGIDPRSRIKVEHQDCYSFLEAHRSLLAARVKRSAKQQSNLSC